ncbi:MAG: RrF2 family transcriptional regulator [bacterium]
MKLSTRGRYGVRAMCDLAVHYGDLPVPLKEVARRQRVSPPYLERLLAKLRKAGLVNTVRGSKGGYILSRKPEEISVGEVYRVLEGPIAIVRCVYNNTYCDRVATCPSRPVWKEISEAISRFLDSVSLRDLCEGRVADRRCPL